MNLKNIVILCYLLIEIEIYEKNYISIECIGFEFRFGVIFVFCNGGWDFFSNDSLVDVKFCIDVWKGDVFSG